MNKTKTEADTLNKMRDLMGRYSLEVVSGDGERAGAEVRSMVRQGLAEWAKAVKELGREPTWAEIYGPSGTSYDNDKVKPEGLP